MGVDALMVGEKNHVLRSKQAIFSIGKIDNHTSIIDICNEIKPLEVSRAYKRVRKQPTMTKFNS